ncbi:conjugal transfer protein (plasmid) [Cellulomonas sp. WB94]|nr:conjugal transfer protein [Cellulomonas sp. WB94]
MSMCVRYAGDSYTYLLDSVAKDHGRAAPGSPMTRYYASHGAPPGTWLGRGLTGVADGVGVAAGSFVTPVQMERLFADGQDPATGAALGRSPHVYSDGDPRRPVAGFDCTFTVPKSVSVLWALADPATREVIYAAHREAVADVLAVIERDVAKTRIGTNGVAQVDVRGVVAAAFDHWDSRENDPNLHTHVVLANRVQGPDGRWRTLDSRPVHRAAVAMSERYDAVLADHVTARLGLDWEYRERGPGRNPAFELTAVPRELVTTFSRRSAAIDVEVDRLVDAYTTAHGQRPDAVTVLRMRQQATLTTRNPKVVHSLEELTEQWHARAGQALSGDAASWAERALAPREPPAEPVVAAPAPRPDPRVTEAADLVFAALSTKRSTWTPWNVDAEASRALKAHRFATSIDRDAVVAAVVDEVARRSVLLTPPALAPTPSALCRGDGSSAFRVHRGERYTSQLLLDAESRLLAASRDRTGPTIGAASLTTADSLYDDQATAVASIASSGRVLDVLVGPAGSGKTHTLAALRAAWEAQHGAGAVVGLAPSAAAADVLGERLGISCENTAKWLVEHAAEPDRLDRIDRARAALNAAPDEATARALAAHIERLTATVDGWRFRPGQLVILDEASLAGTVSMDRIAACVGEAGAKLLLVGDWAQLSAIEAGGAFGLLARDRGPGVPELGATRRFTNAWEREASTRLRLGDASCLRAYEANNRVVAGNQAAMVDTAYTAWAQDEQAGLRSLLIAGDRETVRSLNERARAERVVAGAVEPNGIAVRDGLMVGVGDRVVTRENYRRFTVGDGWVKNGDTWTVVGRHDDGTLTVRRERGGPAVALPAAYSAEHVDLAYATTAFRAQGATVDTAHAVISGPSMTREVLYVAMTRARESNRAYVCTDALPEPLRGFADVPVTGREVLTAVLSHVGAATSAHEVRIEEAEAAVSVRTLAAEYETLAHVAEAPQWIALLERSGMSAEHIRTVEESSAFGALSTALRRAEGSGLDIAAALPRLADRADVGAVDLAAVLHGRIVKWTDANLEAGDGRRPRLVGGLIPAVSRTVTGEMADALAARERLIEERAQELVGRAVIAEAAWIRDLGNVPDDADGQREWAGRARTVAAYRDRYGVTDPNTALGESAVRDHQEADALALATEALRLNSSVVPVERALRSPSIAAPEPFLERQTSVGR